MSSLFTKGVAGERRLHGPFHKKLNQHPGLISTYSLILYENRQYLDLTLLILFASFLFLSELLQQLVYVAPHLHQPAEFSSLPCRVSKTKAKGELRAMTSS